MSKLTQIRQAITIPHQQVEFAPLDWVVMVIYLGVILGMGFFFWWWQKRKKLTSSADYFTGGGKTPTWVVGFSIWATSLSSITYLAVPGTAFQSGWMWAFAQLTIIVLAPFFIKYIIPFFHQMKATSAYSYLENRFDYSIRAISSAFFIMFHIFRIAIVIYIPIAAISLFVNVNSYWLVAIMGTVVVLGTLFGGMKGVLWSDAIQGLVLLLGIVLVVIFGLVFTQWSNASYQTVITANQWQISWTAIGIPLIFVSNIFNTLYAYIGSQDVVQRYKAKENIADINKTLWINTGLGFITIFLFYGAGSILYSYYSSQGFDVTDPKAIQNIVGVGNQTTNLMPYFVVSILPMGISGLIISAVFAASQSTVSSSLSSLANSLMSDFIHRFLKMNDRMVTIYSKVIVLIAGIFGTALAMSFIYTGIDNVLNYFLGIVGLFGAPVAAVFLLGMFTKKANGYGVLIGLIMSSIVVIPLWVMTQSFIPKESQVQLNSAYFAIINFSGTMLFGYFLSWIIQLVHPKILEKDIQNLSWATASEEFKEIIKVEKLISKQLILKKKKKENKEVLNQLMAKHQSLKLVLNR